MCFIQMDGGTAAPELDRAGRARSARSRNTRRVNDLNEDEDRRLGTIYGRGPGTDLEATIAAARRALTEPLSTPSAPHTPNPMRPLTGGLPTIRGGS